MRKVVKFDWSLAAARVLKGAIAGAGLTGTVGQDWKLAGYGAIAGAAAALATDLDAFIKAREASKGDPEEGEIDGA